MNLDVAIVGCLAWIPLGIWIYSLLAWMIAGDIDFLTGFVGIWIAIGLGYLVFDPPQEVPMMGPLLLIAILGTVILFPLARAQLARRELRSIEIDALQKAYETLHLKPANPLPKLKIAKIIYHLGMPGHALAIGESLLSVMPEQYFIEEHKLIQRWKATVHGDDVLRPIECVECGEPNEPGLVHCKACGAPFLLDRAKGRFVGKGLGRRLVAAWITLVAVLAGIPASTALPPAASVVVIVVLLVAAGLTVWLAFRPTGSGAAA